jgi:hypothetical protein
MLRLILGGYRICGVSRSQSPAGSFSCHFARSGIGVAGTIGPERVRAPAEAPTTTAKWITNVTRPTLSLFRPAADNHTGTAVVICPGGGYWNLAWERREWRSTHTRSRLTSRSRPTPRRSSWCMRVTIERARRPWVRRAGEPPAVFDLG